MEFACHRERRGGIIAIIECLNHRYKLIVIFRTTFRWRIVVVSFVVRMMETESHDHHLVFSFVFSLKLTPRDDVIGVSPTDPISPSPPLSIGNNNFLRKRTHHHQSLKGISVLVGSSLRVGSIGTTSIIMSNYYGGGQPPQYNQYGGPPPQDGQQGYYGGPPHQGYPPQDQYGGQPPQQQGYYPPQQVSFYLFPILSLRHFCAKRAMSKPLGNNIEGKQ